jgi:hypothetical protein
VGRTETFGIRSVILIPDAELLCCNGNAAMNHGMRISPVNRRQMTTVIFEVAPAAAPSRRYLKLNV